LAKIAFGFLLITLSSKIITWYIRYFRLWGFSST